MKIASTINDTQGKKKKRSNKCNGKMGKKNMENNKNDVKNDEGKVMGVNH